MAMQEPPCNSPQIFEVIDPSDGFYRVVVRIPTALAGKFPDRPWGVAIDAIGMAAKDVAPYVGYVLVDFDERNDIQSGDDLYWVFQKLDGPEWYTNSYSRENLTPQKYRGQILITKSVQEVLPDTMPETLTGDLVLDSVEQIIDSGKAVRTKVNEVIDENAVPLYGQLAYVEKEVVGTSEILVPDGTPATAHLYVSSSKVEPLGNGKSVKTDLIAPSWTLHFGQDYDPILDVAVPYTEQFAAVGTGLGQPNTTVTPVNKDRVLVVVQDIPFEELDTYMAIAPARMHIDIPRVLESAEVIWNTSTHVGTQDFLFENTAYGGTYSLGEAYTDAASAGVSVTGEVQFKWKDYGNGNVHGEERSFYLKNPVSKADIEAKVGASAFWPTFQTDSPSITILGQSVSVVANASCGLNSTKHDGAIITKGWQKGVSDDQRMSHQNNTYQIPPCLHGELAFLDLEDITVTAVANVTMVHTDVGSIAAVKTKDATAGGKVYPKNVPQTTETDIPKSGKYIADCSVRPYKWGYSYVTAQVFDAAENFA